MAKSRQRSSSPAESAVGLILGAVCTVAIGGLLLAGARKASEARARRGQDLLLDLTGAYEETAGLLGIEPPPLEFTTSVPNAASDGACVLVNPEWFGGIVDRF